MWKSKRIEQFIYLFYFFSYLLDPTGLVINLKLPALFLLILYNLFSQRGVEFFRFSLICLVYVIILLSAINMLLYGYLYDPGSMFRTFLTYTNIFPILFLNKKTDIIVRSFFTACNILSFLSLFVSIIVIYFPVAALIFEQEPWNTVFIIQMRPILGKDFYMIYHLSSSLLVFALGLRLSNYFLKKKRIDLFLSMIYALVLFFSGARANMLAASLIILGCFIYHQFKHKKRMCVCVFLVVFVSVCAVLMAFLLFVDPESGSNDIKYKHMLSYVNLFKQNMNIFLFGNGPGSWFYTTGFGRYTQITELSYLDVIRQFGFLGFWVIILLYTIPLYKILKFNTLNKFSVFLAYSAYLLVAGTNPLLVVPQGFVMLFLIWNLTQNKKMDSFRNVDPSII